MLKYTEKVGDLEHSFEGDTVLDVVALKNALNPSVLVAKQGPQEIKVDVPGVVMPENGGAT